MLVIRKSYNIVFNHIAIVIRSMIIVLFKIEPHAGSIFIRLIECDVFGT